MAWDLVTMENGSPPSPPFLKPMSHTIARPRAWLAGNSDAEPTAEEQFLYRGQLSRRYDLFTFSVKGFADEP